MEKESLSIALHLLEDNFKFQFSQRNILWRIATQKYKDVRIIARESLKRYQRKKYYFLLIIIS